MAWLYSRLLPCALVFGVQGCATKESTPVDRGPALADQQHDLSTVDRGLATSDSARDLFADGGVRGDRGHIEDAVLGEGAGQPDVAVGWDGPIGEAGAGEGAVCDDGVRAGLRAVDPCATLSPARVDLYTDRASFEAALARYNIVTFDCVDTSVSDPAPVAEDYYLQSHGIVLRGGDGQYVGRSFGWPTDYRPSSGSQMFAPGPVVEATGPAGSPETTATFRGGSCVAGFGVTFIDADYPNIAASSIEVFDAAGQSLGREAGFAGSSGSALFRGYIAKDALGNPMPAIHSAGLVNGNVWPAQECCEGVTLDDFIFGSGSALAAE